jgi:hypothetical protein
LELDYVNMAKPTTIYLLNPGRERSIDRILMGFPQHKQKGSWYILVEKGLNSFAEIYFSQKDADTFNNKMNQSFAAI